MKVLYFLVVLYLTCISSVSFAADNYCEALKYSLLFYKAQRAGRLPDADIPWRGNSVLGDTYNNKVDSNGDGILSKGYFDAGDGVKFGFPMAYTMTMLSWIYNQYESNIVGCGLDSLYKDVIKWGSDYTIASHVEDNVFVGQIADANVDHSYWIPPEDISYTRTVYTIDSNNPGTDLAMEASASLAATYLVFKSSDSSYANECLSHAKTLYSFAINSDKKLYSDSIKVASGFYTSGGYNDEIAWASAWLYKATGESSYLSNAATYYANNEVQYANQLSWDQKGVAVGMLLYQINNGATYKSNVETALKYWQKNGGVNYTPNGLAYLNEWGPCRYSMNMALIASMYGGDYASFAESQLNYVLGNNAKSYSFIAGWGSNYPKNPHHRASHHSTTQDINNPTTNTYVLYGALVGGPASDDSYKDDRTDYTQSEVALDYNVGLVGTLAAFSSNSAAASTTNPYTGNDITSNSDSSTTQPNTNSDDSTTTPGENGNTLNSNSESPNADHSESESSGATTIQKLSLISLLLCLIVSLF
ncbi:hypothetical protein DICPUDRAFT_153014 [Dictyostelium purpureum]|uniref:cellulase n=1 Tax=Dictyostelium purpureum TaxID=5786 RepID=F0ZMV0_DICPU|nr:uncharacterized protein DICPUDRAFT_153014 [Dictyostelium purpureum]EGC34746.1 hypothetical protein DICPUDRAFT_153014 [Dictyostelium purpureum]|eukprot:XP_003288746.1 hypothetical protein DICPUDRAFT_153014 [Dictyostelium purpureum]